jgi:membrane-associated phospholipid phosphatase
VGSARVRLADRRLQARLAVALAATALLGLPFLLLALLVRSNFAPLRRLDLAVARELNELARGTDGMVGALDVVARAGDPNVFRAAAAVLAVWLLTRRRFRLALWTVVATAGGALLGLLLKLAVGRARPVLDEPVAYAAGLSFPSGHALNSVVGVGVLLLVLGPLLSARARRLAWAAGVLVVLVIGFDRVALGVHYLSDVVAGWVVAACWLALTAAVFEAWRRESGLPPSPPLQAEPEIAEGVAEPRIG